MLNIRVPVRSGEGLGFRIGGVNPDGEFSARAPKTTREARMLPRLRLWSRRGTAAAVEFYQYPYENEKWNE